MIITLTTDFGLSDPFVGVMKGVIKSICPHDEIIDITHGIPPQDIEAGAIIWSNASSYFPPGTIHVGIVDPGVGSERLPIAVKCHNMFYICPNNGLLTYIADKHHLDEAYVIANNEYTLPHYSRTFHGRDIFSPAAAYLASGINIEELGDIINEIALLEIPRPIVTENCITAHIIHFDHFGNAWTNLEYDLFQQWNAEEITTIINGIVIDKISNSYSSEPENSPLLIFASHNNLEISIRNGNARDILKLHKGMAFDIIRS